MIKLIIMKAPATSALFASHILLFFGITFAQAPSSQPGPGPDERFKADILLIVAHADDEAMVNPYLARVAIDGGKRVAVIYTTRSDRGGNAIGYEQTAALGAIREIEARRGLNFFGIHNVWFIGGPDTPTQNVLHSLANLKQGSALEQTVRLVRLTRPEVILTWLPNYVVGQNHGDHQAAGVIATEAFDSASDPTAFPAQLAFPSVRYMPGQIGEGLRPWQPKKLYYFTDASHTEFLAGRGPQYKGQDVSPARGVTYNRLSVEETSFHLSQDDTGQLAQDALKNNDLQPLMKGDLPILQDPVRLIFGKSLVRATVIGDVFEGTEGTIQTNSNSPITRDLSNSVLELGGAWSFYRHFWRKHRIDHLSSLYPPEMRTEFGQRFTIPLLLQNNTSAPFEVTLDAQTPTGWTVKEGAAKYLLPPGGLYPVEGIIEAPTGGPPGCHEIIWRTRTSNGVENRVGMRVYLSCAVCPGK